MVTFEASEQIPTWIKDIMSGPAFVAPEGMSLAEYYQAKGMPTGYTTPPPVTPEQFAPGSEIPYWVYSKENKQKIEAFKKEQAKKAFPVTIVASGPEELEEGQKPSIEVTTIEGVTPEPKERGVGAAIAIGILALALAGGI